MAFCGEHVGAAEQRRHLVERFAVVADEHRRNAERLRAARSPTMNTGLAGFHAV